MHIYAYVRTKERERKRSNCKMCIWNHYPHIEWLRYITILSVAYTDTGWWRHIGCLKLQIIFRKRATNHRALLRKLTCEDKASYDSTPPCIIIVDCVICSNILSNRHKYTPAHTHTHAYTHIHTLTWCILRLCRRKAGIYAGVLPWPLASRRPPALGYIRTWIYMYSHM